MICSDLSSSNPVAHKGTHKYVECAQCGVRASRMNDLAVTVTIPCVQQAANARNCEFRAIAAIR